MKAVAVLTALVSLAASGPVTAGAIRADVYTKNPTHRHMWVTIYDETRTRQLDYGCVDPGTERKWSSGGYLHGSFYYVRAEWKVGLKCDGPTLCDTRMQINPQWENFVVMGGDGGSTDKKGEPKSKNNKVLLRASYQGGGKASCFLKYGD